ncbi:MAG: hypothetical protein ABSE82_16830 [Nitrososphaerales archaeon]|jgi:hypothetical protein
MIDHLYYCGTYTNKGREVLPHPAEGIPSFQKKEDDSLHFVQDVTPDDPDSTSYWVLQALAWGWLS